MKDIELDNFDLSNLEVEEMVDSMREIINRQDEFIFYKYGEDCMSFKYSLFIDLIYNLQYSLGFQREMLLKDINDHFDMIETHDKEQKEEQFLKELNEINKRYLNE